MAANLELTKNGVTFRHSVDSTGGRFEDSAMKNNATSCNNLASAHLSDRGTEENM
jgi:hypothetical protein